MSDVNGRASDAVSVTRRHAGTMTTTVAAQAPHGGPSSVLQYQETSPYPGRRFAVDDSYMSCRPWVWHAHRSATTSVAIAQRTGTTTTQPISRSPRAGAVHQLDRPSFPSGGIRTTATRASRKSGMRRNRGDCRDRRRQVDSARLARPAKPTTQTARPTSAALTTIAAAVNHRTFIAGGFVRARGVTMAVGGVPGGASSAVVA